MAHWICLSLLCRCKWTRKSQVWYGNVSEQHLLLCKNKGILCLHRKSLVSTQEILVSTQEILVHAQDSCACTRFLCMHNTLVHAQHSCACTRGARDQGRGGLCMHKNLGHAQCTIWFLRNHKYCSETFPYQTWDFLFHLHLHSRRRRIQWALVISRHKNESIWDFVNYGP